MRSELILVLTALAAVGCRRSEPVSYQRVALPPFENLTGDARNDWLGTGLAELFSAGITGSARWQPLRVETAEQAPAVRATHLLHGYFRLKADQLEVRAILEDLRRLKTVRVATAVAPREEGFARLAGSLLENLGLLARCIRPPHIEALHAYADSLHAADPVPYLERALATDPDFSSPYLALFRYKVARGDLTGAREVMVQAGGRTGFDAVERARMGWLYSSLSSDLAAQLQALQELARLTPAESEVWQAIAERRLMRREIDAAVRAYAEALARDPDNPLLLNEAAYASAYAGDFAEAVARLERYRRLQPAEPNPDDSLGDIYYQFGRFAEAEACYRESAQKSSGFAGAGSLLKAAYARLMQGDTEGAQAHFGRYLEQRRAAGDPWAEARRAEWEYLSGHARRGIELMQGWAGAQRAPEQRALGLIFLAAWKLEAGEREQARRYAEQAVSAAQGRMRLLARLFLLLCDTAASPGEWEQRVRQAFPQAGEEPARLIALAHALLLNGYFREAVPVLRELVSRIPPSPSESGPILLAWALLESGQDAGPWLARWRVPDSGLPDPLECFVFPRIVWLRARMLERQGKTEPAGELYRLFLRLAGDRPDVFRERQRAAPARGR